ncbi:hypothetical protein PFNF135_00678 [Plasmodium falciparum NF135/5.C10]|uniref:Surface antigen n=1 Tax=Plasmodium falciparum NF135/5.C10 TaxID=1036726 RepID=W4IMF5_PLAFA|nr:hypothetical protein PFNF135_00678 [Plasmodium falciparum NF135/5.C10]
MKVHYINILLFALPLNILENTHKKPHTTPRHTQKIPTTRSLSECELYAPVNYYSDPQMKEVMDNFNKQTQQRFHEYDERMKTTRQKCKEKCDKEIQKIILKDKLEKDLNEKFSALHTDIQSDDIPTCVCEKSIAEKAEKGCLRCGYGLGSVAPMIGLTGSVAVNVWKTAELAAATAAAEQAGAAEGAAAGIKAGIKAVIAELEGFGIYEVGNKPLKTIIDVTNYMNVSVIYDKVYSHYITSCTPRPVNGYLVGTFNTSDPFCKLVHSNLQDSLYRSSPQAIIKEKVKEAVAGAEQAAEAKAAQVSSETSSKIITEQKGVINTIYMSNQTAIIASIIAIIIIVLIMVIIYLILRYRRKRKMKKKLQYIKLLEE